MPGAGKSVLRKSLSLHSLLFSFTSLDFSPFLHLHDKGAFLSLHVLASSWCIYLPGAQLSMLALKPRTELFLLLQSNSLMLKDSDHPQERCRLVSACSDFTEIVLTADPAKG